MLYRMYSLHAWCTRVDGFETQWQIKLWGCWICRATCYVSGNITSHVSECKPWDDKDMLTWTLPENSWAPPPTLPLSLSLSRLTLIKLLLLSYLSLLSSCLISPLSLCFSPTSHLVHWMPKCPISPFLWEPSKAVGREVETNSPHSQANTHTISHASTSPNLPNPYCRSL